MTTIQISPEARNAIASQFELLELSAPGIYIFREPPKAELSRSAEGEVVWIVERPQQIYLHFGELASSNDSNDRVQVVDGIRTWIPRFRDTEDVQVQVTADNLDLFVDVLHRDEARPQPTANLQSEKLLRTRTALRLGTILDREIVDAEGPNRLRPLNIFEGLGQNFHSLHWDYADRGGWRAKLRLTRKQFQGQHIYRRWVANLHSFTLANGVAIIQVAEGDRPIGDITSCNYLYSWRAWDLQKNIEVKRLKDCKDPFEPLD